MFKKITVLIILYGAFFSVGHAQVVIGEEVENNIKLRVDNGVHTSIVVGIVDENGKRFFSYGVKSLESGEKVDEHSIYEIGSISKTFTGILLATNVVEGEMKLSDPVQKYLPEGVVVPKRNGDIIQLVNMANHTSSLPRMPDNFAPKNPNNPYVDYTEKHMYDFLSGCKLSRDIGSEYEYSNYAMALLGHILATKSGMPYEDLMVKVIAQPLGMDNTRVVLTSNMQKNLAKGYNGSTEVENWDLGILAGAGGIRSSAEDMLKYVAANMGLMKSKCYPAMQLSHTNTRMEGSTPAVGLAWHITPLGDQEIISHGGATGGYQSFAGFIKGTNTGVVVLTNSSAGVEDIGLHILNPEFPLQVVKPSIALKLKSIIEKKGVEEGVKVYWELKENEPKAFDFSETELNNLGYEYLGEDKIETAIAIFNINIKAYPEAFNAYDSRGEAFLKKGDKEKAIADYKKSVELNPANQSGINALEKLGVNTEDLVKEVIVDDAILESYVGKYELAPSFIITVSKEGSQLKAQATGQPQFSIFAKSEDVFYLKVVQAEISFNKNEDGGIESLTLFQGGNKSTGKKTE